MRPLESHIFRNMMEVSSDTTNWICQNLGAGYAKYMPNIYIGKMQHTRRSKYDFVDVITVSRYEGYEGALDISHHRLESWQSFTLWYKSYILRLYRDLRLLCPRDMRNLENHLIGNECD